MTEPNLSNSNQAAAPHTQSTDGIRNEVEQLRFRLEAWSEEALARFRWTGVVPMEDAMRVIQELIALMAAERQQSLAEALRSTKSTDQPPDAAIARLERELNASRDAEAALLDAATKARAELQAVRQRSQQIIDQQALQLLEFKRELDEVAFEVRRARAGMDAMQRKPADGAVTPASPQVAAISQRRRRPDVVQLAAIDAALADSPPVSQWPRVAV